MINLQREWIRTRQRSLEERWGLGQRQLALKNGDRRLPKPLSCCSQLESSQQAKKTNKETSKTTKSQVKKLK